MVREYLINKAHVGFMNGTRVTLDWTKCRTEEEWVTDPEAFRRRLKGLLEDNIPPHRGKVYNIRLEYEEREHASGEGG